MKPEIELARMQFLGFLHAKAGYSLIDLVRAMGLNKKEWEEIKSKTNFLKHMDIEEIDEYLKAHP